MGTLRPPVPVKLFIGMLSPKASLFSACTDELARTYGPLDFESDLFPWNGTAYYREELGMNIIRKFIFFRESRDPAELAAIKRFTIDMESRYSNTRDGVQQRTINIDPGYVTEAKVVLATTKDFAHRIYIGQSIYAEVTLRYSTKERRFIPHEFTYPDFRTDTYCDLFKRVRENLRHSLGR